MKIGVLKESSPGEARAAAMPETLRRLAGRDNQVFVQSGLGAGAGADDAAYESAGATVCADAAAVCSQVDLVLKVTPPTDSEVSLLKSGQTLACLLNPVANVERMAKLAAAGVTAFSMDAIPRITRAQAMDVLSSQATVAGYKAVLLAADHLPKMMPMMMTAAGTIKPAHVMVIGAGVAGLQAIATARRLGGVVQAVDTRPAAAEQVESLGAKFVSLEVSHEAEDAGGYAKDLGAEFYKGEQDIIAPHLSGCDAVITTAAIPGRRAPILITDAMVASMRPGSVIVDLAGLSGGNCELSKPGETTSAHGVTILCPLDLPSRVPADASRMYATNIANFVNELVQDGALKIDLENELIAGTLITRDGQIVHEATQAAKEGSS